MKITGKLILVEHHDTSKMGNPRYYCVVSDNQGNVTSFYTAPNSSYGYSITNYRNLDISVELAVKRGKLTLVNLINQ